MSVEKEREEWVRRVNMWQLSLKKLLKTDKECLDHGAMLTVSRYINGVISIKKYDSADHRMAIAVHRCNAKNACKHSALIAEEAWDFLARWHEFALSIILKQGVKYVQKQFDF